MKKTESFYRQRPIAIWIMTGVAMLVIQVVLGGITRLTGSGLSITEWDVITGTLPPLNTQQWVDEFQKYRQTSQYRLLNADFNLADFKSIFFWEWFHRFWGRLIAIAFVIPFVIFLIQRRFKPDMVKPLLILFLLGALQGLVGWIMVASGLTGDAIYVKPAKLAMHFTLACILIGYAFWFGLQLIIEKKDQINDTGLRKFTWLIIGVLFVQLVFGALMAGYKAAPAAPTWPDINGTYVPDHLKTPGGWQTLFENPVTIHFVHRGTAYLLIILLIAWTFRAFKRTATPGFSRVRWVPVFLGTIQVILGISAVLASQGIRAGKWNQFEWMAVWHQLTAILLFMALVAALYFLQGNKVLKPPAGA